MVALMPSEDLKAVEWLPFQQIRYVSRQVRCVNDLRPVRVWRNVWFARLIETFLLGSGANLILKKRRVRMFCLACFDTELLA